MEISHSFAYEKRDGGAVILRCFLRDGTVEVPKSLEGLPVTALDSYAFSSHDGLDFDAVFGDLPEALCGNALRELFLPDTIRAVGRYCFYNCGNLSVLSIPRSLTDFGSGAFSGCHHIREIRVHAHPDERTGLDELLGELKEGILVTFFPEGEKSAAAKVFFPSFYENGVENTPARILVDEVHGTGILYRNAFDKRELDFARYDALFPYARAQEDEGVLIRLSLCRLLYPYRLGKDGRDQYEAFVREHLLKTGIFLMDLRDTKRFSWLLHTYTADDEKEVLQELSKRAASKNQAEMQSILMAFMQENPAFCSRGKRLEL